VSTGASRRISAITLASLRDFAPRRSGRRRRQLLLVQRGQQVGGAGLAGGALRHAHVQRRAGAKGEAARVRVDLVRRDPQVQEHPVQRPRLQPGALRRVREVRLNQPHPLAEALQPRPRLAQRLRVAVGGDQPRLGAALQERLRVAPAAQRSVQEEAASLGAQEVHHLGHQDGGVVGRIV
jgi:hypothetical protein